MEIYISYDLGRKFMTHCNWKNEESLTKKGLTKVWEGLQNTSKRFLYVYYTRNTLQTQGLK